MSTEHLLHHVLALGDTEDRRGCVVSSSALQVSGSHITAENKQQTPHREFFMLHCRPQGRQAPVTSTLVTPCLHGSRPAAHFLQFNGIQSGA